MERTSESVAMHAALRYVVVSDIPFDHKRVLIDTLTRVLREDSAAQIERMNTPLTWEDEEVAVLTARLSGKIARSWQHADEMLMRVATELRRNPVHVRAKAIELGHDFAVDFARAKTRVVHDDT